MLNKVSLQGSLAEKYGREFYFKINTPLEALRALFSQLKGFEKDFRAGNYQILRKNKTEKREVTEKTCMFGLGNDKLIISPTIAGAATGAIILTTLAISYVAQKIFTPVIVPKEYPAAASDTPSFIFNGATNVAAQGICVPLVYGIMRVGSVVISASIISERLDLAYPSSSYSLVSVDTMRIVDVISEGEIEGLVDGGRSIFYDDTPLQAADVVYNSSDIEVLSGNRYELPVGHGQTYTQGQQIDVSGFTESANNGVKIVSAFSGNIITVEETLVIEAPGDAVTIDKFYYNFSDVLYIERYGTSTQDHIPGFPSIEASISVNAEIVYGTPLIRTVTGADLDSIRIDIKFPQGFYRVTDWGGVNVMWVRIKIEVKPFGGSYEVALDTEITGRTTSPYEQNYRISLPSGVSSWDVKITKIRWVPQEATSWVDTINWHTYTTIIDEKLTYPDTAIIATALNAKAFNSQAPKRAYEIKGIKCPIPSNYNPITRVYTGIWDGTFGEVYSSSDVEVLSGNIYELPSGHGQTYLVNQEIIVAGFTESANNGTKIVSAFSGDQITVEETLVIEAPGDAVTITHPTAWTDNPAWVLYDILTSVRYGLGQNIDASQVDKWELYNISQFCDEWVDSGFGYNSSDIEVLSGNRYELPPGHGQTYAADQIIIVSGFTTGANNGYKTVSAFSGDQITVTETLTIEAAGDAVRIGNTEPRYTFNGILGKREQVYATLNAIVSNFHGMIYWGSGTVSFSQDRDNIDPIKLVTPANVIDGILNYSGTSQAERPSVVLVSWNNPENNYKISVEVVEDSDLIAEFGWKPANIIAFGCTSRGQAYRQGKNLLVSQQYESERLNYKASFDHADLRPGDVISVVDPAYSGVRFGGRIVARTLSAITIDDEIEIEVGESYEMSVILSDGTIETKDVTNSPGSGQTVITLSSSLSSLPLVGSMWIIAATNVEPRQFKIVSVSESDKNIFDITAIFKDPDKFTRIESDIYIEENDYSAFDFDPGALPLVSDIEAKEYSYRDGGSILAGALISCNPPTDPREVARIAFYEFQFKGPADLSFSVISTPTEPNADLKNLIAGLYTIRVRTLDALGGYGDWTSQDIDILGVAAPPADVENFSIQVTGASALLSWSPVPDIDLSHYRIKYSASTTGATWGGSVDMATGVVGNQISLSARVGTYLIKAVDVFDSESVNAALIVSAISGLINFNIIETLVESPDYPGTHVDTYAFDGKLQLGDGLFMSDWTTLASVDALVDGTVGEGIYYFDANYFDLGAVFTSRLTASFDASGWNRDTMAADEENWDVILQIRYTLDDPSGTPTWSDWQDFLVADYTARAFEWRIKLLSLADDVTPLVENLQVVVDMPDRVVGEADLTCPAAGLQVDYDLPFKARPALAVDGQNLATGDYHKVTSADESGFYVQFFNSTPIGITTTFDYVAKGYGVSE